MGPLVHLTRYSRSLLAVVGAMAIVGPPIGLWSAASAVSGYKGVPPPTPQTFAQCPLGATVSPTNKPVADCLVGTTAQGTIDIGGLDTTFHGPGILQGGINLQESFNGIFNFAQARDGQSYSAPQQLLAKPVLAMLGYPSGVEPPAQSRVYVASRQAGPITFGTIKWLSCDGAAVVVPPVESAARPQLLPAARPLIL